MEIKPELVQILHTIKVTDDELNDIYKGLRLLVGQNNIDKDMRYRLDSMIADIEEIGKTVDEVTVALEGKE